MEHLDLVSVHVHEYRNLPPQRLEEVLAARKHCERVPMQILEDRITSGDFRPDTKHATRITQHTSPVRTP